MISYLKCDTPDVTNPPAENPANYEQAAGPEDVEKNRYFGILCQKSIQSVEENVKIVQIQIDGQNENIEVEKKPKCEVFRKKQENVKKSASVEESQELEINTGVRDTHTCTSAFSILMDPKISKSSKLRPNKLKSRRNPMKIQSPAKMSLKPSIYRFLMKKSNSNIVKTYDNYGKPMLRPPHREFRLNSP